MLRTNYFRWCLFHPYLLPNPGCRQSQSRSGPSWSGCLSLVSFEPEDTCWPRSVSLAGGLLAAQSHGCLAYFTHTVREPSPSAPEKEKCLVLGWLQARKCFLLWMSGKACRYPHPTLMLSLCSMMSNWRAAEGLLGTQGICRHWVPYSYGEL